MTQTPRDKSASRGDVKQWVSDLASYLIRKRQSLLNPNRPKSPQWRKSRKGEGSFLLIWSGDYLIDFFNTIFFYFQGTATSWTWKWNAGVLDSQKSAKREVPSWRWEQNEEVLHCYVWYQERQSRRNPFHRSNQRLRVSKTRLVKLAVVANSALIYN